MMLANDPGFIIDRAYGMGNTVVKAAPVNIATIDESFGSERSDRELGQRVKASISAYRVDGIVRQAVDKYAEQFRRPKLVSHGNEAAKEYLERRLQRMGLVASEPWRVTVLRFVHELFKHGNPTLLKVRGLIDPTVKRPLYRDRPHALNALFFVSPDNLVPARDRDGVLLGWKTTFGDLSVKRLQYAQNSRLDPNASLIKLPRPRDSKILIPTMDLLQCPYRQPSNSVYGIGIAAPVLNDIAILRSMEQSIATLIRKSLNPLTHHKILTTSAGGGMSAEIRQVSSLYQRAQSDGILVTGPNHEITVHGNESQALRAEGYYDAFIHRVFTGLGVSAVLMGYEGASVGDAENVKNHIINTTRTVAEFVSETFRCFLFAEILWEGGFDPYENPKDNVSLEFDIMNLDERIRADTHWTDLYTKNAVTWTELRNALSLPSLAPDDELYLRRVQIPLSEAGKQDPAAPKKKATSSQVEHLKDLIPKTEAEVAPFVRILCHVFDLDDPDVSRLLEGLRGLIGDETAQLYFLKQVLQ